MLLQARELIPKIVEFKLTHILNGSKNSNVVSDDVYIPPKLKKAMEGLGIDKDQAI